MMKFLLSLRYVCLLGIGCSVLGSMLMFVIGATKTWDAFQYYTGSMVVDPDLEHLLASDIATALLIKALDSFLIGLVLLIFVYGVFALFIQTVEGEKVKVPGWDHVPTVGHFKKTMGEAIVVILFVTILEEIWIKLDQLTWEVLVLPGSILLLSLGLKFLGLRRRLLVRHQSSWTCK